MLLVVITRTYSEFNIEQSPNPAKVWERLRMSDYIK